MDPTPRVCAAFVCREWATTSRTVPRVRRRETPHVDGWVMAEPVVVFVCEAHRSAPEYQLDLG